METYIHETIFILFQVCFIIQLYFLAGKQSRLASYNTESGMPTPAIPISVIISARNEATNLRANLPAILDQNYPDFEVIVVNDCSFDTSEAVLMRLKETWPRLKIVTITEHPRFKTGKKFALTLGIKAAKNEHMLFTDADCHPASSHWITRMAAKFTGETQIVLGYSPYSRTGNLLNPFIRFETIKTAVNYLSAALNGDPYMGIGRNMAYTKTLFFGSKGFAAHMHVLSGDDDLFVNQNATPDNTAIELHPDSFMYTEAKTTIRSWFRQKRRHFGVGKLYKSRHRNRLSADAISGLFFYALFILSLIYNFEPLWALGIFIFRLIVQLVIYRKVFNKLNGRGFLWYLPFFDMIYYVYLNVFGLAGSFMKTTQWR